MLLFRYCPKCGSRLRKATKWWEKDAGYEFLCDKCDENYFSFETVSKKERRKTKHWTLIWTLQNLRRQKE